MIAHIDDHLIHDFLNCFMFVYQIKLNPENIISPLHDEFSSTTLARFHLREGRCKPSVQGWIDYRLIDRTNLPVRNVMLWVMLICKKVRVGFYFSSTSQ